MRRGERRGVAARRVSCDFLPPPPVLTRTNTIPDAVWHLLLASSFATFAAFMIWDSSPNLLLAGCSGATVAIFLWATLRMYRWNLLLSPVIFIALDPRQLPFYSWGNLGARAAGTGRYHANPGSLEFYPQVALLTLLGLVLFTAIVFGPLAKVTRLARVRYEDLVWKPWQPLAIGLAACSLLLYLSLHFPFTGGYFRGVESNVDRWLSAARYFLLTLTMISAVSVTLRRRGRIGRLAGPTGIFLSLTLAVGMGSRTAALGIAVIGGLCWITLRPRHLTRVVLSGGLLAATLFVLGSVVKSGSGQRQFSSILGGLSFVKDSDLESTKQAAGRAAGIDVQYRMAGFELPAAILLCQQRGAAPMYGAGIAGAARQGLPNFLRPEGNYSERGALYRHLERYGLVLGDSMSIPLASGLGDWGFLGGPLIYVVMALYMLLLWRVAQVSPRLFLAILMAGGGVSELFWDDTFYSIRAFAFAWLLLKLLDPILMPRWERQSAVESRSENAAGEAMLTARAF